MIQDRPAEPFFMLNPVSCKASLMSNQERWEPYLYVSGEGTDVLGQVVVLLDMLLRGCMGAVGPGLCPQGIQAGLALC